MEPEEGVDVVAACFAEAWEAEAHLRSLLRSSGAALLPPSPALDAARHRLREACRQLLLTDVAFGVEKDVDQTTWKLGHYRLIEQYRRRLRKLQTMSGASPAEAKAASESLGSFLAESSRFYAALLQELRDRYAVVLDGSVTYSRDGAVPGLDGVAQVSSHPAYLACHRCLVILGDLARYRKDAANSPGWATEAVNHYKRAVRIWSDNGNAHNQLAVVATHNGDDLEAAYRYARAINTPLPFPTARDNLAVLYQKIRQSPIDPTPPTLPASALVPKFLLLQASIGCPSVAPDRFDELWEAYVRQVATVELGTAPLTDRVLYCMMTISTFSVGDLLGRQTDNAEAFEQALELMLHLAETLLAAAAAVTSDNRRSFELLPAVGHFLGWAAAQLHPPSLLAARLSARDLLCDSLLRLAKARNNSASAGKWTWPGHWEDEELRGAFALGMAQTAEQHTSMQVALAALRLHQSLRPHLAEHQEEPPAPPLESGLADQPAVQQLQPPRVRDGAAQGRESGHRSPTAQPAPRATEPPRPEPAARDPAPAPAPVKPTAVEQQKQREGRPAEAGVKRKPIAEQVEVELELEQELLPTTTTAKTTTATPKKKQKKAQSEEHPVPPSPASRSCRQTLILRHPFTTSPASGHFWRAALLADTQGFPAPDGRFGPRPPQHQPRPPPPPLPASANPFLSRV